MDGSATLEQVPPFLERHREALATPGIAVAVTDRERCLGVVTDGLADVVRGEVVRPDHRFQIGSISKGFTALAVLRQVEAGRIALDARLVEYLPWFEVRSDFGPIAIHHLLSHTSGLVPGIDFTGDAASEVWSLRDTVTGFPPGERFLYSNVGYKALGLVLETATGSAWWELVREGVMEPIGMGACDVIITTEARARQAAGHTAPFDDRPWLPRHGFAPSAWFESATADGTICATAEELTAYARLLLRGGTGVVSGASFAAMTAPVATIPGSGDRYGYGVRWRDRDGGAPRLGHSGGMIGFAADLLVDPASGFGVVVLMNSVHGDESELVPFVFSCLEAEASGRTLPDVPEPPDWTRVADAAAFAGRYGDATRRIVIEDRDGALVLEADDRRGVLVAAGEDEVFAVDDPALERYPIRFERSDDVVTGAFWGPSWLPREGAAEPAWEDAPPEWPGFAGRYVSWNPWAPAVEVFLRRGELWLAFTGDATDGGGERRLEPLEDGTFRFGEPWSPNRVRFDQVVDGVALRAVFDGAPFFRTFAP
ncbi:MAG: serine hydrolase domain-containing protein [Actinomycetota bacterium]